MTEIMNVLWIVLLAICNSQQELLYTDNNIVEGYLSGYNQYVIDESIAYYDRLNYSTWCGFECRHEAEFDGYIVVAHCNRIGQTATLSTDTGDYNVLVVDCIAQEHVVEGNIFSIDNGYIGEVDYNLFQLLNTRYGILQYGK